MDKRGNGERWTKKRLFDSDGEKDPFYIILTEKIEDVSPLGIECEKL